MRLLLVSSLLMVPMLADAASYDVDTYSTANAEKEYVNQVSADAAPYVCESDVVVIDVPYYEQEYQEYYAYDTYVEDVGYDYSVNDGIIYPYAYDFYYDDSCYVDDYYYDVVIEENCDTQLDGALADVDTAIASAAAYVQAMQQYIMQMIGQIIPLCACNQKADNVRDTVITSLACEGDDIYDYYYDYYDYDYYYDVAAPAPTCTQVIKRCVMKALAQAKSFGIGMASGAAMGAFESEYMHPMLAPFDDKTVVGVYGAALGTAGVAAYAAKDTCVGKEFKKTATMVGMIAGLLAWYHYMGEGIGL